MDITLKFDNHNMEGENNILHSHVYETIKYDFE